MGRRHGLATSSEVGSGSRIALVGVVCEVLILRTTDAVESAIVARSRRGTDCAFVSQYAGEGVLLFTGRGGASVSSSVRFCRVSCASLYACELHLSICIMITRRIASRSAFLKCEEDDVLKLVAAFGVRLSALCANLIRAAQPQRWCPTPLYPLFQNTSDYTAEFLRVGC